MYFGTIGPTKLQYLSTFYTFADNYTMLPFKKGDNVSEICYKVLTGYYANGDKLFENNFKDVYWNFKMYETKFPEALKLRFELI
jgi:hypothetical protein